MVIWHLVLHFQENSSQKAQRLFTLPFILDLVLMLRLTVHLSISMMNLY